VKKHYYRTYQMRNVLGNSFVQQRIVAIFFGTKYS